MLADFDAAGILSVTTAYEGAFPSQILYSDSVEPTGEHFHIEEGSWNLASTTDPFAHWGTWEDSDWDFNDGGMNVEPLADGRFEGANAVLYFTDLPAYGDDQLDIPLVPEPFSATLLAVLAATVHGRRPVRHPQAHC
jgi:hypothetical protein